MARKRKLTGDDATNARKRFYRSAERYLKQAAQSAGATAARYRELARLNLQDALKTYTKKTTQGFSKPIQKIANTLGIDLNAEREKIKGRSDDVEKKIRDRFIDLSEKSKSMRELQSSKRKIDSEQLRQDEARKILNSPIGQRIIGGTVEIWQDAATVSINETETQIDKTKILPALFDYFKVNNLADLLDKVEQITGDVLYAHGEGETFYDTVKLTLQNHIASNNSVTA